MDHWHAKQDLLQQFLSYGASCTEVLNLKWSIQSQLNGSAGVPPLLTISTARCMVNGLLLPERRVVVVTIGMKAFLDCILTTVPVLDKHLAAYCLCRVGLSMNGYIELQPWPPRRQDCNNLLGDTIKLCCSLWSIFCLGLCLVASNSRIWHYTKRRFPVTSNLRYMHGVLNVDEIKN